MSDTIILVFAVIGILHITVDIQLIGCKVIEWYITKKNKGGNR